MSKWSYLYDWADEVNRWMDEIYGDNDKRKEYYLVVEFTTKQRALIYVAIALALLALAALVFRFSACITDFMGFKDDRAVAVIFFASVVYAIMSLIASVKTLFEKPSKAIEIGCHNDRDRRLLGNRLDSCRKMKVQIEQRRKQEAMEKAVYDRERKLKMKRNKIARRLGMVSGWTDFYQ